MKLKAKSDWVILEPLGESDKDSSILQFGAEQSNRNSGKIVSVGRGMFNGNIITGTECIDVGKIAHYDFSRSARIVSSDTEFRAVRAKDIWAISQ